jgi:hypothetical protein
MSLAMKRDAFMDMNRDLDSKDAYFSYLLRIWWLNRSEGLSSSKENIWRVSLECTRSRKKVTFTSLEDLFCFLQDQMKPKDQTLINSKDKPL